MSKKISGSKSSSSSPSLVSSGVAVPAAGAMDIPLDLIVVDEEFNARKQGMDDDSIAGFARSLDEEGLLQPVVVEPLGDGKFYLKAGFRRLKAFRYLLANATEKKSKSDIARWSSIKAMVDLTKGADDKEKTINRYFVNIAENVARKNITPYDLALRCKLLKSEYGISGSDIAKRVGKNTGYINNLLAVVGEGEKGEGVIAEVMSRWQQECSWPEDDKRTKVCTTDELNRMRKMTPEGQKAYLDRELFIAGGGDADKYDAGLAAAGGTSAAGTSNPDPNTLVRPSKQNIVDALEAVQKTLKGENVGKEERTRLNGVVEGLKFALGVKSGLTNRIRGIVAFKDGKIVEGANAPS